MPVLTKFETAVLAAAPKKCRKLILTDVDGTLYRPDTTVVLNERFGSRGADGELMYKKWRREHQDGLLSISEHLGNEFADVLRRASLEEVFELLHERIKPTPGLHKFLRWLRKQKIKPIAVTNGAETIARELLHHHGIRIKRVIGNKINFNHADGARFETLSGPIGLDKGGVLEWFLDHGYKIHAAIGDSTGDIGLATAAGKNKVPVFAAGHESDLARWCAGHTHLLQGGWWVFEHFMQIPRCLPA